MQITHRFSGKVLYEGEHETTIECVHAALRSGANLRFSDLRGADLRCSDLRCSNLRGSDLRGSDLRGANLRFSNLREADLRGADLQFANLREADLRFSNLREADLRFSNLREADLRGDDLQFANLRGAVYGEGIPISVPPIYITGLMIYDVLILDEHVQIGCALHSLDDWLAMEEDQIRALDDDNAVACWRQWGEHVFGIAQGHRERCREKAKEAA